MRFLTFSAYLYSVARANIKKKKKTLYNWHWHDQLSVGYEIIFSYEASKVLVIWVYLHFSNQFKRRRGSQRHLKKKQLYSFYLIEMVAAGDYSHSFKIFKIIFFLNNWFSNHKIKW